MRALLPVCAALGFTAAATPAAAKTYGIVVGYNGVPNAAVESLQPLRYADDDAARWATYLGRFADVSLLTVLDTDSQQAHPGLAATTRIPTAANLKKAVDAVKSAVEEDAKRGEDSVVFFVYSGHGAHTESGAPFLTLHGGDRLGREDLYASIGSIPTRFTHVVVDACHAAAIVGAKGGFFGEERDAKPIDTEELLEELARPPDLTSHPQIGALLAASAGESSHEWSEVQSGVFTHEVLSALHGAADINSDGKIEYSEVAAYIASANREVPDPRAVPTVVARPPAADARAPLVDVRSVGRVLSGTAKEFGRFSIETTTGVRVAEGHLDGAQNVAVVLPDEEAHVRVGELEAVVPADSEDVALASLAWSQPTRVPRGAVDAAFRRGLFAAPYGPAYYRGFVDSHKMIAAPPAEPSPVVAASEPRRGAVETAASAPRVERRSATVSILLFSAGGAFLAGGVASSLAAADAARDFQATPYPREAAEASDRFARHRNRSFVLYAVSGTALLAGLLAYPWPSGASAGLLVGKDGAFVSFSGNW